MYECTLPIMQQLILAYVLIIINAIIFGGILNILIKSLFDCFPLNIKKYLYRPNNSNLIGFPSGHGQIMGVLLGQTIKYKLYPLTLITTLLNIYVWYDRINSMKHTTIQYIAGNLIGLCIGLII